MEPHQDCAGEGNEVWQLAGDVRKAVEWRAGRGGNILVREGGVCFARRRGGSHQEWFLPYSSLTWKHAFGTLDFLVKDEVHSRLTPTGASRKADRENLLRVLGDCVDTRYPALLRRRRAIQLAEEQERLSRQPVARLIRTAREGEEVAAEWLQYFDGSPAQLTPAGADGGVDAFTNYSVAQVKMEAIPTGRPAVQMLFGVAAAEKKRPVFFSLAGYTNQAAAWASQVGMPLFQFDLQGVPSPVNDNARVLLGLTTGQQAEPFS